jgi:hypothetical protein
MDYSYTIFTGSNRCGRTPGRVVNHEAAASRSTRQILEGGDLGAGWVEDPQAHLTIFPRR